MIMPPLITPERIIANVAIRSTLLDLHQKILDELPKDLFAKQIKDALTQKRTPFKSELADWEIRNSLIFYQGRIYVTVLQPKYTQSYTRQNKGIQVRERRASRGL